MRCAVCYLLPFLFPTKGLARGIEVEHSRGGTVFFYYWLHGFSPSKNLGVKTSRDVVSSRDEEENINKGGKGGKE